MNKKIKQQKFSLIELLIVVGILGVLTGLILPSFTGAEDEAKKNTAKAEMRSIQKAFQLFLSDVNFRCELDGTKKTNKQLLDITKYGLWPILIDLHPVITSGADMIVYQDYDTETGFGRRTPYLEYNGLVSIKDNTAGQERDDSTNKQIPVIRDPYGGYYRILYPNARAVGEKGHNYNEYKRLQRMVLVCTGPNKKLDTKIDSFIPVADAHASNADEIVAQKDDMVIRLMPFAGF